ncbi:TrkH family potassium uptake protein [Oligosphaera ethanolica]|uniref:Potassium uptake TrkH family protein n=1 Tax=Oligosphaera ethanolica TaxID=760260 RepID=A0AAE4AQH0_9BACT|nr:potassium transporter TrkG [Oligosphaera ethanolica]MDQ0291088.1 potassium uptake TrkH family protein [Oligosphaera ethanolica]
MARIGQQYLRRGVPRSWATVARNILSRNMLLVFLGACFHLFLLFPLRDNSVLFGDEGFIALRFQPLLLIYLLVLVFVHIVPGFFRYWRGLRAMNAMAVDSEQAGQQWLQRFHPSFAAIGTVTMLPLPLYLLVFPVDAHSSLVGIACCFVQGYYLLLSLTGGRGVRFLPAFLRRSDSAAGEAARGDLLEPATVLLSQLLLCGSLVMVLYTAGEAPRYSGGRFWSALAFTLGALAYNLMVELRLLLNMMVLKQWTDRKKNADDGDGEVDVGGLSGRLLGLWSFMLSLPLGFWLVPLASIGALLVVAHPVARGFWLLALFVRQLLVYVFFIKVNGSGSSIWKRLNEHPGQLLVSSFLLLIVLGGSVLSLPVCSASGQSIGVLNGLFTATSAVCVTGLTVVDTATAFSLVGKTIIIILIQCGGLGIMTMSFFIAMLLSRRMSVHDDAALRAMTGEERNLMARRLLKTIVMGTFVIEACGTLIMTGVYHRIYGYPLLTSCGYGAFMSISAFCNAGFALHSDSAMLFSDSMLPLLTMASLIILGGLSFEVIAGALRHLFSARRVPMAAHIRLVLFMTFGLCVVGTFLFYRLESGQALAGMTPAAALSNAFFHSVTTRTAGFNAIAMESLSSASAFLCCLLMFIGVAPGSTGGGVKVTTFGVLLLLLRSRLGGRTEVIFSGRRINPQSIAQAAAVLVLTGLAVCLGVLLLAAMMPSEPLAKVLFEVISAVSTTGLSLGTTTRLAGAGKVVIMMLMFLGRVGPLSFFLALRPPRAGMIEYADARIVI